MRKSSKGSKASVKVEQPPGEAQHTCMLFCSHTDSYFWLMTPSITLSYAPSLAPPATEGVDDVKVKAVNEMMERIKHGVVLRPVKSHESKVGCERRRRQVYVESKL